MPVDIGRGSQVKGWNERLNILNTSRSSMEVGDGNSIVLLDTIRIKEGANNQNTPELLHVLH